MKKTRLIDTYAHSFDVTETRAVFVDAQPAAVLAAAERLELPRAVAQAIEALGLADRLALAPTRLASRKGEEHVWAMHVLGAFDQLGCVKVIWDVRVEAGGETGTMLSTTTRFVASDLSSRERLRAAWSVLGPVSAALSKRALAAVKRYADEQQHELRQAPALAMAA